ncbi:MAG: VOC family protein [Williamsia herbipolensis]|jgi:catechol 2,3-dioxygenase-like lactoylglutathione lyase family enzyme|nr:VOC family protein [Williamsia herbipolensis]
MRPTGIVVNISVPDSAEARDFYTDFLGLSEVLMDQGWVARLATPDGRAQVQLVTRDAGASEDSHISVQLGDGVAEAHADARRRGLEIVHPLTTEEWGVRRFFVRAPDGTIVNVVGHAD